MPLQQQQNLNQQNAENLNKINNNVNENGIKNYDQKSSNKTNANDNHIKNPPPPAPYSLNSNNSSKVSPLQVSAQVENFQFVVKSDLSPVSEEDLVSRN